MNFRTEGGPLATRMHQRAVGCGPVELAGAHAGCERGPRDRHTSTPKTSVPERYQLVTLADGSTIFVYGPGEQNLKQSENGAKILKA